MDYRTERDCRQEDWWEGRRSWRASSCSLFPLSLCFTPWFSLQAPNSCRNVSAHITIPLQTSVALRLLGNKDSFKRLARLSTTESHSSLLSLSCPHSSLQTLSRVASFDGCSLHSSLSHLHLGQFCPSVLALARIVLPL